MTKVRCTALIIAVLFLLFASPSRACENDAGTAAEYVEAIGDLPVHKGMTIAGNGASVFDAPEGRIVEVYLMGKIDDLSKANETVHEAAAFYKKVLPTLGWREKSGKYVRNNEVLQMEVIQEKCPNFKIKFSLKPL